MSKAYQFPDDPNQPNPFGDAQPPPNPNENPYASPQAPSYEPGQPAYYTATPHRGGTILALGILSLVGMIFSLLCSICCFPIGALFAGCNLALSLSAWLMGRADLQALAAGAIDPSGRGVTQTGHVLGIVSTIGNLLALSVAIGFFLIAVLSD